MADAYQVGKLCTKIAGRDAGKIAVIVDVQENKVLLDGNVRRRLVSKKHVLPYDKEIKISKGADHATVEKAFKDLELPVLSTKPKQAAEKPVKKKAAKKPEVKKIKKAPQPKPEAPASKEKAPEEKPPQ
jgi:large subunit ribosomal protein L14e